MKAVYIHGFAGSIHSDTITNFRKYYPNLEWCPLEVNHLVDESVQKINDFLRANSDVQYLIGSSLGGFYVLCADFAGRKIVINPVLNPMSSLKKAVGVNKYRGRRENGVVNVGTGEGLDAVQQHTLIREQISDIHRQRIRGSKLAHRLPPH